MTQFDWLPAGLFRDPDNGRLAGVCAGLGNYFEVKPKFIRLALILGSVFGLFAPIVIGYILLTWLMPVAPRTVGDDRWGFTGGSPRGPASRPGANSFSWERVGQLRQRFSDLDRRLADMEARVTSDEFRLRQQFRDLYRNS